MTIIIDEPKVASPEDDGFDEIVNYNEELASLMRQDQVTERVCASIFEVFQPAEKHAEAFGEAVIEMAEGYFYLLDEYPDEAAADLVMIDAYEVRDFVKNWAEAQDFHRSNAYLGKLDGSHVFSAFEEFTGPFATRETVKEMTFVNVFWSLMDEWYGGGFYMLNQSMADDLMWSCIEVFEQAGLSVTDEDREFFAKNIELEEE